MTRLSPTEQSRVRLHRGEVVYLAEDSAGGFSGEIQLTRSTILPSESSYPYVRIRHLAGKNDPNPIRVEVSPLAVFTANEVRLEIERSEQSVFIDKKASLDDSLQQPGVGKAVAEILMQATVERLDTGIVRSDIATRM